MPEFYLDFDTQIIEANSYEEALEKGKKIVEEIKRSNSVPKWHIERA